MSVDTQLGATGDALMVAATAAYTVAMLAFTADLVMTGRRRHVAEPARDLVAVGAGAGGPDARPGRAEADGAMDDLGGGTAAAGPGLPPAPRTRAGGAAVAVFLLATGLHLGAVAARGIAVGRVPWSNAYEFATTGALAVSVLFAGLLLRREARWLGAFVALPVLLTLGLATAVFHAEASALAPALQSFWLVIHVAVAFIAAALFTVAFSVTVLQLVQLRIAAGTGEAPPVMRAVPGAAALEAVAFRLTAAGFVLWTFTLVAGAIWAEHAWGRYWGWDPKEVWSLVIWVVYAAYLHARATAGWGGRRAAWLGVAAFACLLFNFFGVNYLFSGLHSYA